MLSEGNGRDSDAGSAGATLIPNGLKAVCGSVLEPQSAETHRSHRATPSPGRARKEKDKYTDGVVGQTVAVSPKR